MRASGWNHRRQIVQGRFLVLVLGFLGVVPVSPSGIGIVMIHRRHHSACGQGSTVRSAQKARVIFGERRWVTLRGRRSRDDRDLVRHLPEGYRREELS